jgi:uncharacterized membrane protein
MAASASPDRVGSMAAWTLAACAVGWAVLVPLSPWLHVAGSTPAAIAAVLDGAGSIVCHQKPERSFAAAGHPWPVCARCSGIYLAAGTAVLLGGALPATRRRLAAANGAAWRAAFAMAIVPIALTWALERAGLAPVSNLARALSGVPLGSVIAAALLRGVRS